MRTEIDLNDFEINLNECEHFLKANQYLDWSIHHQLSSLLVNDSIIS